MKRNYYCLVAGFQDIYLDIHKLQYTRSSLMEELKTELYPDDFHLAQLLFYQYDNQNLLNLLLKNGKPFDERAIFSREEMEENIKEPATLPDYMKKFIVAFNEKEPLFPEMSSENELATLFYDQMLEFDNEFLRHWFEFELNVKNVTVALISRKHDTSYEKQVVGTSETSNVIRKSHARDFGLSGELHYIEDLVNLARIKDLQEREKAIDELRWKYLDEVTFFEYFTAEKVLAFIIKLGIIERWLGIDKDAGNELFKKLLEELKAEYELPEIFQNK